MASSLLLLLDDIATIMDDVAVMSKVAAKKTAGVLGDDLALNAQQVSGVRTERELPIVWRVAKGSFVNKLILVPLALLISWLAPVLINPLLVIGGLFLCYEGVEKIWHTIQHRKNPHVKDDVEAAKAQLEKDAAAMTEFENEKVKGAIRTDFILSAEIVVITLGTISLAAPFVTKLSVLSFIAIAMTVGVYGLVALIVKLDDMGLYLVENKDGVAASFGQGLLSFSPILMKILSIVGTAAMFLVGGGIINHAFPFLHHFTEDAAQVTSHLPAVGSIVGAVTPTLINFVIGAIAGIIVVLIVTFGKKMFSKKA
jgi:predicted DNA repair protein MutK